ncbi:MAG: MCE family protein, partial [Mycobacterium sp.]
HVRIAAVILAALILASAMLTYLSYTAAFTSTDTVTVTSPRAGLGMAEQNKVKYRGIQIGKVKDIEYVGDQAKLTLAINSSQMRHVPSNAVVRIAGTTIFGTKAVEFVPPEKPAGTSLRSGAHVQASSVQLEVNTLFQTLTDMLHKINPVELNAALTALAEGLRGRGEDLGSLLSGTNQLVAQLNPAMPTVQTNFQQTAAVANIYADAGPDLVTLLDNVPSISNTIVDEQDNLNATLLATIGVADNGYATLVAGSDDYISAIQRARAPLKVLGDYSPEYGCVIKSMVKSIRTFNREIGGVKPGLFVSSNFLLGGPAYTYPESLPIVNATGGPNCRGLPDMPNKQGNGSWYRAPFLVTDNAYIPYEPFTELQVDAPSTLQFLFNGAFAERDDF